MTGLDPSRLILTVDEATVLADIPEAIAILRHLNEIGARCAVGGFAIGRSSPGILARLPIDWIVLDGSIVSETAYGQEQIARAAAIRDAARGRGAGILADGVESAAQMAALRAFGCDRAQGRYLSGARPVESFAPNFHAGVTAPTPTTDEESVNAIAAG